MGARPGLTSPIETADDTQMAWPEWLRWANLRGLPACSLPFLTTIFFSLSVIFAARSARVLGGPTANLARICVATVLLALWAHTFGEGLHGGGLPWFFLSGIIGFGLGDMALFGALPRIGPRLAILITQCLAAPIAALVEMAVARDQHACGRSSLRGGHPGGSGGGPRAGPRLGSDGAHLLDRRPFRDRVGAGSGRRGGLEPQGQ